MIQHYLKIAIRNLLKYRMQTLISIIGLTVGFVSFSLSGMWMNYEQSLAGRICHSDYYQLVDLCNNSDSSYCYHLH